MDQKELLEHLNYFPDTGKLIWAVDIGKAKAGDEVGYVSADGYRYFGFKNKVLKVHRAIYLMMTGTLPKFVDHEDHDRLNNRWLNLRGASVTSNNRNCSLQKNNKSGVVGVSWSAERQRWVAMIWHQSKAIPLGRFTDLADAVAARKQGEILYGYHPNHGK